MANSPIDLIIFDLDGTLLDSRGDIAAAVNHARAGLGRTPLSPETVNRFVGDGLPKLLGRSFGTVAPAVLRPAEALFRAHYADHSLDTTRPFPGVIEALDALRGTALAVVTNKPADFSVQMLVKLGLRDRFRSVVGGGATREKKPHPEPFLKACAESGVPPGLALMVGDGPQDLEGGRAAGMSTCGVTFGFTAKEILEALRPDYLIGDMRELPPLIDSLKH